MCRINEKKGNQRGAERNFFCRDRTVFCPDKEKPQRREDTKEKFNVGAFN